MSSLPRLLSPRPSWRAVSAWCIGIGIGATLAPGVSSSSLLAQHRSRPTEGPVVVRYSEGTVHGFLRLQGDSGASLATGDLLQVPGDSGLESRMLLRFGDDSRFEETTTFTQHHVFALQSYHLVERGPAFARDLDATLSGDGRYRVSSTSHDDHKLSVYEGRLDLPDDVSNGLVVTLVKNLRQGDTAAVHIVAFTPKPQLVGLLIAYQGVDSVSIGGGAHPVLRFLVKPRVGGIKGVLAKMLGKLPADTHIWILTDRVPAFIRFEGPLFDGPVWRLSQIAPEWRSTRPSAPH